MADRNTRSGKKQIAGSHFNPIRDDLPVRTVRSSASDEISDTVVVHPNEDDLRAIGASNFDASVLDATVVERTVVKAPSVVSATALNGSVGMKAPSSTTTAASNTTGRTVGEQPIAGTSASFRVPKNTSGVIRKEPTPMRIVIDPAIDPESVRHLVEIEGRTLESIQRENEQREAVSSAHREAANTAQHMRPVSLNVMALNELWEETMNLGFLGQSKHAIQIRCDLAKQNFDEYMDELKVRYRRATVTTDAERIAEERGEVQKLFLLIQTKMHDRLAEIDALENDTRASNASNPSNQYGHADNDVKMDRMSIERFGGDFDKWPKFKDEFLNFVDKTNKSNTEKMLRLKNYLVRNSLPYELIDGFQTVGENYEAAWGAV